MGYDSRVLGKPLSKGVEIMDEEKKKQINEAIAVLRDFCYSEKHTCLECPFHSNCMVRLPRYWGDLN